MNVKITKNKTLILTWVWVTIILAFACPGKGEQKKLLGDCGGSNCELILATLQRRWPQEIKTYESICSKDAAGDLLGLYIYSKEKNNKKVYLICWYKKKDADGSRTGFWLGTLPFPGDEATFLSFCPKHDENCNNVLLQLRSNAPAKARKYQIACAMRNGELAFENVADKKINGKCNYITFNVIDSQGNGAISPNGSLNDYFYTTAQDNLGIFILPRCYR